MLREFDRVVLERNDPDTGLVRGAVGTVVHVYKDATAFEVEFFDETGGTIAVATLERHDVSPAIDVEPTGLGRRFIPAE